MAFLMLSEFELQPLGLGIKKSSLPVYSSIICFSLYSSWIYFPNFSPTKKGWCEIEIIFVDAFSQAKQNSFGMKCPAHFQNAAADTNTESKTNIVAPVYSSTSLHDHWLFAFLLLPVFRGGYLLHAGACK